MTSFAQTDEIILPSFNLFQFKRLLANILKFFRAAMPIALQETNIRHFVESVLSYC